MNASDTRPGASLTFQRCYNHAAREAVARCPECRRFFCRECVTEHDDRVLCAACLRLQAESAVARRRRFAQALKIARCALGIIAAWFFFFVIATGLTRLPDDFHSGKIWSAAPTSE